MRAFFRRVEPYLTPLLAVSLLFFVSMIVLSLAIRAWMPEREGLVLNHLASLASVVVATIGCLLWFENGRWDLGLFLEPRRVVRGFVRGVVCGALIVGLSDLLIVATSDYRHVAGAGLDWRLLLTLIIPAAFAEELLFRGYVLQKLYRTSASWAVVVTSLLFALAHAGNPAMSFVAFTNIFLAGVVLALMWAWDQSLWMPALGHITWNVLSGPVLGHELSGLTLGTTLLEEVDPGPEWLTGGEFGIEASVILTLVEIACILLLIRRIRARERALSRIALEPRPTAGSLPDMSGTRANPEDEARRA